MQDHVSTLPLPSRRRWVAAPESARLNVPAVLGVYLLDGESVQWVWTHQSDGSFVSGYHIDGPVTVENKLNCL